MKNKLLKLINGIKTDKQLLNALNNANVNYQIDKYTDYLNVKIPTNNGCLRIYKPYGRKNYVVQEMTKTKLDYSGIPTFFTTDNYF